MNDFKQHTAMSNTLIPKSFPHFVPDQVLTDTQLNSLRDYLDTHDRLTRTHLVGTGIVCGLHIAYSRIDGRVVKSGDKTKVKPDLDAEIHTLSVSAGYGITSRGYLIIFPANSYTRYRQYEQVDQDGDQIWDYDLWADATKPIYELVNDDTPLPAGFQGRLDPPSNPLEEQHIKGRVLVLFLEKVNEDLKSCMVSDCSNKGVQAAFHCRVLLVHQDDLPAVDPAPGPFPLIQTPRLHTQFDVSMDQISNSSQLRRGYGKAITHMVEQLKEAILEIDAAATRFLDLDWNPSNDPIQNPLEKIVIPGKDLDDYNQYHYDLLRDLAQANNEFWAAWRKLIKHCNIRQSDAFPCHLMLGQPLGIQAVTKPEVNISRNVKGELAATHARSAAIGTGSSNYRNEFRPAPVRDAAYGAWQHARTLVLRLVEMIHAFDVTTFATYGQIAAGTKSLRITPSQTLMYPLGRQAIPYYYRVHAGRRNASKLPPYWQPATTGAEELLLSYHYQKQDGLPAPQSQPLGFDILPHSFLRIEGHVGKNPVEVAEKLKKLRQDHQLEFGFVFLFLGEVPEEVDPELGPVFEFGEFVRKYPGMEHSAGVVPGGTFLLVIDTLCPGFDDDVVVADFSLAASIACCLEAPVVEAPPTCPEITTISVQPEITGPDQARVTLSAQISGNPTEIFVNWGDERGDEQVETFPISRSYSRPRGTSGQDVTVSLRVQGPDDCYSEQARIVRIPGCPDIEPVLETQIGRSSVTALLLDIRATGPAPDQYAVDWGDGNGPIPVTAFPARFDYPRSEGDDTQTIIVNIRAQGPFACEAIQSIPIQVPGMQAGGGEFSVFTGNPPVVSLPTFSTRSLQAETPPPPAGDPLTLRKQDQQTTLYTLNQSGTYAGNRSYQSALDFVSDEQAQASELAAAYREVNGKLMSVFKRASGDKQAGYQQMMLVVAQRFMDRLVAQSPSSLPSEARETLEGAFKNMKDAGISLAALKKAWNAAALKKATGALSADQINRLIS